MSYPRPAGKLPKDSALAWFETLEERRLLAVAINGGFLMVQGTPSDDKLIVSLDPHDSNTLVVDDNADDSTIGKSYRFDIHQLSLDITGIYLIGDSGSDLLQIDESNGPIRFACHIMGDSGDDTLIGGPGDDNLPHAGCLSVPMT